VLQPGERLGLTSERPLRASLTDEVRSEDLGHDESVQSVVPGDIRLEPLAATKVSEDAAVRREGDALGEVPSVANVRGGR
jgi:hypothetical protein